MSYPRSVARGRGFVRVAAAAALAAAAAMLWILTPPPSALLAPPATGSVALLDRAGLPLRTARAADGARQRWLGIAELDPDLLAAFVAAEDRRFYEHRGVDLIALGRAARDNLRAGSVTSGASTITMQLARLLRPMPRTWAGKAAQVAWAVRLDRAYPKQVILEQYLNRVPLGQGTLGVDAAARLYFGRAASELSLGQAALLAGLARAPSRDNPLASLARARARRDRVLDRIEALGLERPETVARARREPVLGPGAEAPFAAPHFTTWVLGSAPPALPGGLLTSLDLGLQRAVEAEVRHTVAELRWAAAEHAAAVILANRTGEVLAWVGSPDFHEPTSGQVDMVISPRQPGSTLKPFLYGLAFDRGYTPATVLPDVPTVYRTSTGPYAPRNYDRRFRGPTRIREALGSSFNVPAVELASRLGVAPLLATLHRAGVASLTRRPDHYGLGLALGNGEVTLLELANAYRALANGGVWHPVRWTAAAPGDGPGESRVVISPPAAALVLDILSDPVARIPGFGPVTPLDLPFRAAAKTGTSRNFTDNWAVAVTAGFTVAVWVGNFSGRPMGGVSGVSGAGPLLQRVALLAARRYDPGALPQPADLGFRPVTVCRVSGLVAGPHCPTATEWLADSSVPGATCHWHRDGEVALPAEYAEWAARAGAGNAGPAAGVLRVAEDSTRVGFRITSPRDGDTYRFVPGVDPAYATVGFRAAGAPPGAGAVQWYVNGQRFAGLRWPLAPGIHRIRAVAGPEADEITIAVQ